MPDIQRRCKVTLNLKFLVEYFRVIRIYAQVLNLYKESSIQNLKNLTSDINNAKIDKEKTI